MKPGRPGLALPLLLAAALVACGPAPGTPEATARDFLDAHYVIADLQATSLLTTGLAASKLAEEIRLTDGLERGADTMMPRINYRLERRLEEGGGAGEAGGDVAVMVYRLTVSPAGTESFDKEVLLRLVRRDGKWLVSNYGESDVADP